MYTAEVRIGLKKGVADPEGANTHKTLQLLGFQNVKAVHAVRAFELEIDAKSEADAKAEVDKACQRLLANPVIHEYTVSLRKK